MRLLIVEDDETLTRGLTRALRLSGFAVDHTNNGDEAVKLALSEPYALVILDIGIAGISGFKVLEVLRKAGSTVPVMILTAREAVSDKVRGLDLGADDYVAKPFDLTEFEARVRALVRRPRSGAAPLLICGNLQLDQSKTMVTVSGQLVDLRRREYAVLFALMRNPGRLIPKKRLMAEVFGFDEPVAPNAIELYVARLRRKLPTSAPGIRTIRGLGYMLEPR